MQLGNAAKHMILGMVLAACGSPEPPSGDAAAQRSPPPHRSPTASPSVDAEETADGAEASDAWATMAPSPLAGRQGHAAVWTGSRMIVWGGLLEENRRSDDGAIYDPQADRWQRIAPGPLSPRSRPVVVWTGTEMLVAGGFDGTKTVTDGAAYDPEGDEWRAIPSGPWDDDVRLLGGAWSGEQAFFWGSDCERVPGQDLPRCTSPVASYDPAAGEWSPIPHPPLRLSEVGTWTGRRLLVFACRDETGHTCDGTAAAYEPGGTWTRMPDAPVPAASAGVWTGEALAVWGGWEEGRGWLEEGAMLDPGVATWTRTPPGPLAGRAGHTATWTGESMIVWGGRGLDDGAPRGLSDGASFDPAGERWGALPEAPLRGRSSHTAVWTGDRLIVWGGGAEQERFADGAAYLRAR